MSHFGYVGSIGDIIYYYEAVYVIYNISYHKYHILFNLLSNSRFVTNINTHLKLAILYVLHVQYFVDKDVYTLRHF